jgi:hypothetical protein
MWNPECRLADGFRLHSKFLVQDAICTCSYIYLIWKLYIWISVKVWQSLFLRTYFVAYLVGLSSYVHCIDSARKQDSYLLLFVAWLLVANYPFTFMQCCSVVETSDWPMWRESVNISCTDPNCIWIELTVLRGKETIECPDCAETDHLLLTVAVVFYSCLVLQYFDICFSPKLFCLFLNLGTILCNFTCNYLSCK